MSSSEYKDDEIDTIRESIIQECKRQNIDSRTLADEAGIADAGATYKYLSRRCSLNTRYVSKMCRVLGLELQPIKRD